MPSKIDGKKVGFVGAGAMAEALARGFVDRKVVEAQDIWCCDPSKSRTQVFMDFGSHAVKDGTEVSSTNSKSCCDSQTWEVVFDVAADRSKR